MSFQAVTWAIEQSTGSPSAKATLWSIANYANEHWVAYPKQETIAGDSEQSVDSVQRRIDGLVGLSLLRRIKLKRYGRRTHDFLILPPSPLYAASIEDILPFLPSGCDVMEDRSDAAADCGSVKNESGPAPSEDSTNDATAICGSAENPTLPQSAVDATAMVRQQEYVTNQDSPPQTPPQSQGSEGLSKEAGPEPDDPRLTRLIETYSEHATGPVLSNPDAIRAEVAKFTDAEWERCIAGARGVATVRRRDPKHKGIVGLLRYVRAPDLWGHYGKFAPVERPAIQRYWADLDSDEWRGRAVLYAIIGRDMPQPKPNAEGRRGADFNGRLPQAGLVLARFADQHGCVSTANWILLDHDQPRDRQRIAAWCERIKECLGVDFRPGAIRMPGTRTTEVFGKKYTIPNAVTGLRVPANPENNDFPPPKGSSEPKPDIEAADALTEHSL